MSRPGARVEHNSLIEFQCQIGVGDYYNDYGYVAHNSDDYDDNIVGDIWSHSILVKW